MRLPPRRVCKRPACAEVVGRPTGRSRPPVFCSERCRRLYSLERASARTNLHEAQRLAEQFGIDSARARSASALGVIAVELQRLQAELDAGAVISTRAAIERLTLAVRQADQFISGR